MIRRRIAGAGVSALVALSFQLLLGASAAPCTSMAHSGDGKGAQPSSEMPGMPAPDSDAGHGHEDCGEQHTMPVCLSGSACAVAAIPAVALFLAGTHAADGLPAGVLSTLRSALTAPDQPPPRA